MGHNTQSLELLGQVSGQNETRRAAVQENRRVWLNLPHRLVGDLILLQAMDRQPLLNHRLVKVLRSVYGLDAPEALDQPAPLQQAVHVATDGHF